MPLDIPTLMVVTVIGLLTAGLLLMFAWLQDRGVSALAYWGTSYLLGAAALVLLAARGKIPDWASIIAANAVVCVAYGIMWRGTRAFDGRTTRWRYVVVGLVIWLAACQIGAFYDSFPARVMLMSLMTATYTFLCAHEVWRGADRALMSRWPVVALLALHGAVLLSRVGLALVVPDLTESFNLKSAWVSAMIFEALLHSFCISFLLVNMAKERAELRYRRASLIDPLTGVANRRAFFERSGAMLEAAVADRRPVALVLFDLDRFKEINDTFGHAAGDEALALFCETAQRTLGRGELFGRLGGEEFAALIPAASLPQAVETAERIRMAFATASDAILPAGATVSAGVVLSSDAEQDLASLLVTADRALYRAKASGRNRTELARGPLVVFDGAKTSTARSRVADAPATSPA